MILSLVFENFPFCLTQQEIVFGLLFTLPSFYTCSLWSSCCETSSPLITRKTSGKEREVGVEGTHSTHLSTTIRRCSRREKLAGSHRVEPLFACSQISDQPQPTGSGQSLSLSIISQYLTTLVHTYTHKHFLSSGQTSQARGHRIHTSHHQASTH